MKAHFLISALAVLAATQAPAMLQAHYFNECVHTTREFLAEGGRPEGSRRSEPRRAVHYCSGGGDTLLYR